MEDIIILRLRKPSCYFLIYFHLYFSRFWAQNIFEFSNVISPGHCRPFCKQLLRFEWNFQLFIIAVLVAVAAAQIDQYGDLSQPTPYEYAYTAESDEGSHGHSEKFDGNSRAEG